MPQTPETHSLNKRKLRKLLIYPRFQLLLIGINVSILVVVMVGFAVYMQNTLDTLTPAAELSGIEVQFFRKYLETHNAHFRQALAIGILLALSTTFIATLWVSHRMAGPLVRMRKFFTSLKESQGEIPHLEFRDGDYLRDLSILINEAIAHIATWQSKRRVG